MGRDGNDNGFIRVLGARQHNLKNVDVDIPTNRLTVITGVSGSGKSSLAFDTLYAEGQRRYVESLSAYARQFLDRLDKPRVRDIQGISPAIAIRQKNSARNPRSTVGTVTEIYDYLRLLYSRVGTIVCRSCGRTVKKDTIDEILEQILKLDAGTRIFITFPFLSSHLDPRSGGSERDIPIEEVWENLLKQGFYRLLVEGHSPSHLVQLPQARPSWEQLESARVLVDRIVVQTDVRKRLTDSLEQGYFGGGGVLEVAVFDREDDPSRILRFTERFECQYCNIQYRSPEPRLFSFNNPYGACPTCQGFGNTINLDSDLIIPNPGKSIPEGAIDPMSKPRYRRFQRALEGWLQSHGIALGTPYCELPEPIQRQIWKGDEDSPGVLGFFAYLERKKYKMHVRIFISRYRGYTRCPDCSGERLRAEARDVYLGEERITQLTSLPVVKVRAFFSQLSLSTNQQSVAEKLLREIEQRLDFLIKVGLEYLTLDRLTSTLSGGEMQRIQLAASLSSSLVGTLYVLDEPSIGLHPRDERRLIRILKDLRDLGNTIVVVEHEREMIESADQVIDMGPGAGELGGRVVHSGDVASLIRSPESLTGQYLSGARKIPIPIFRRPVQERFVTIHGARQHNLKNLTVRIPLGLLVCITGVSGSGKSTLVHQVLYAGIKKLQGEWRASVGRFDRIEGAQHVSEVMLFDQNPIGKTPRSNPVTYLKAFDEIRAIFASVREARTRNLRPGHFSFNVSGGRCETCQGCGVTSVQMQFLADVELTCEDCKGRRFQNKILEITYKGKNIADVLDMTVSEALQFFRSHRRVVRKLKVLKEVGLEYLQLGQSATTLSGGEAQRIKLASFLAKPTSGSPLFIFDEPTTGLHFDDVGKLLKAFDHLLSQGATVVVTEHNLEVIKCADWIIDLGPEGGERGGEIVVEGPPEMVISHADSFTGRYLAQTWQPA